MLPFSFHDTRSWSSCSKVDTFDSDDTEDTDEEDAADIDDDGSNVSGGNVKIGRPQASHPRASMECDELVSGNIRKHKALCYEDIVLWIVQDPKEFELFCKYHNIITPCMPAHSSHILQPLDVGCFGPLKKAYGKEIEGLMRARITYITKADFLPAFCTAFKAIITEKNI